nr:nucleolin-like [Aegilops tauschii subsp. strangulata]
MEFSVAGVRRCREISNARGGEELRSSADMGLRWGKRGAEAMGRLSGAWGMRWWRNGEGSSGSPESGETRGDGYGDGGGSVAAISEASYSRNKPEEQVNLSEGTSPSGSYDEGSRSTPSNFPKAATRQRKKRNSDSEDEDFVIEEEVTSKKKVLKKEYAAATKPGLQKKAPPRRAPMSKVRASTHETMKFTLEQSDEEASEGNKKIARSTTAKVLGRPSMREDDDDEEEEEERVAPSAKTQKLMGDATRTGAPPPKPKSAPKPAAPKPMYLAQAPKTTTPKRPARNILAAEKNKAPVPEVQEDDEPLVLRKLKSKIPDHNDDHPVAENMKLRKDHGLRLEAE